MLLRDIHEFIPAGSCIVLDHPVSLEFNPHLVQAIETHPEAHTIRLMFNGGPIELVFNPRKTSQSRLTASDLIQIKNSIWDVAMHASSALERVPGGMEFAGKHHVLEAGGRARFTPVIVAPDKETRSLAAAVASTSSIDPKMMERLEQQGKEFDTLGALWKAFSNLPPVVDDDYPEMRHIYDAALRTFIDAIRENGRLGDI